ncbi:MAG: anthranilate phosphoribosyltransferase [Alphaproteobacteria bacterium]
MTSDVTEFKTFLDKLATGASFTEEEAAQAFDIIMSGNATPAQVGAFLMGLRVRGETVAEIAGAARVMRNKMLKVEAPGTAMDIVGTGGDGLGTVNVSAASAFVVAGAGVPVAKHGNRAFTSKSGAADVLTALGVNIDASIEVVQQAICEVGVGFLMAPRYHGAMRHVGGARVELGTRTIFNLLGPLCNPAMVKVILLGTYAPKWVEPMAKALHALGVERAWVVHGRDGLDEISLSGPTMVAELKEGAVSVSEISPEDAGIKRQPLQAVKGGTPEENAIALRTMLGGAKGAFRDFVLLNAGAALVIAGKAPHIREGASRAAEAIDSGRALTVLDNLIAMTRQVDTL